MKLVDFGEDDVLVLEGRLFSGESLSGDYHRRGTRKNRKLGLCIRMVREDGLQQLFSSRQALKDLEEVEPGRYRFPRNGDG